MIRVTCWLPRLGRIAVISGTLLALGSQVGRAQTTLPAVLRVLGTQSESFVLNVVSEACLAADLTSDEQRSLEARGASDQFISRLFAMRCKVKSLSIQPAVLRMRPSERMSVDVIARDSSGSQVVPTEITWSIADTTVATVVDSGIHGMLLAKRTGVTELTVEAEGRVETTTVTVAIPLPQRVAISRAVNANDTGSTRQLVATVYDENGTLMPDTLVRWRSANPGVVFVSSSGVATGGAIVGRVMVYAFIPAGPSDSILIEIRAPVAAKPAAPSRVPVPATTGSPGRSEAISRALDDLIQQDTVALRAIIAGTGNGEPVVIPPDILQEWRKDKPRLSFTVEPAKLKAGDATLHVIALFAGSPFTRGAKRAYVLRIQGGPDGQLFHTLTRDQQ